MNCPNLLDTSEGYNVAEIDINRSGKNMSTTGKYELGSFELQSGAVLQDAFIGFRSYGSLNEARDNVILFPTWYTGVESPPL